mmetsp:Transcript_2147/g.6098  ORF Transcript_2147/g.6098 Transcript_2147/m.6098 type:complete len:156 (+) Transcript_2147:94-561(+)
MGCSASSSASAAPAEDGKSGVKFTEETPTVAGAGRVNSDADINREFKKASVATEMNKELHDELKAFFNHMDDDKNGEVTKDEAIKFWGKNFAKVNANAMFNEVDEDGNASISWEEFLAFWQNVIDSGYDQEDLVEEVKMIAEGGSWVDFNDGRTT